ncbi:MAG TPA: SRPBCC family protein [Candidatus Limnocylindrales bacterium]|nr:SRPBCC family protein [Candidatus Limnocylindrales bacterium]
MSSVRESVEVQVPLSTAYNQWTQFESYPQFMEAVDRVEQLDDRRLQWTARVGPRTKQWQAEIVEQVPDQVVAWRSTSGAENSGRVTFESLGPDRTRVNVEMEIDPEGLVENVGDALGFVDRQVKEDLERFKAFIESRGVETGAWRGTIDQGVR